MSESFEEHMQERARTLRKRMTFPERLLWSRLRRHSLGSHFRRQVAIGPYVADFACPELRLIVEVDGMSHSGELALHDPIRQAWLERAGWRVVRVTNDDVLERLDSVVGFIQRTVDEAHKT